MSTNSSTACKAAVALRAPLTVKAISRKEVNQHRIPLHVNSARSLRRYLHRNSRLRALDHVLENSWYRGCRLEKYRHDVLLKLYQGMTYPGIVAWLMGEKNVMVSPNTVKNFTISMVSFGFLPKGMESRLHHNLHRPWDIEEASDIIISGWKKGKTPGEIKKLVQQINVPNPKNLYKRAMARLLAKQGLSASSYKPVHPLLSRRQEVVEDARKTEPYRVFTAKYGVSAKGVGLFLSWLTKQGDLPEYYMPKSKLSMHRPVVKRCVDSGMNAREIWMYLRQFEGVKVSLPCVEVAVRNLPRIAGL